MNNAPIACSLTSSDLHERRRTILNEFRQSVVESKELEEGYSYALASDAASLRELVTLIELERQCCPFLRFRLALEPDGGPMCLELTGPPGTKEFLADLLN